MQYAIQALSGNEVCAQVCKLTFSRMSYTMNCKILLGVHYNYL